MGLAPTRQRFYNVAIETESDENYVSFRASYKGDYDMAKRDAVEIAKNNHNRRVYIMCSCELIIAEEIVTNLVVQKL